MEEKVFEFMSSLEIKTAKDMHSVVQGFVRALAGTDMDAILTAEGECSVFVGTCIKEKDSPVVEITAVSGGFSSLTATLLHRSHILTQMSEVDRIKLFLDSVKPKTEKNEAESAG